MDFDQEIEFTHDKELCIEMFSKLKSCDSKGWNPGGKVEIGQYTYQLRARIQSYKTGTCRVHILEEYDRKKDKGLRTEYEIYDGENNKIFSAKPDVMKWGDEFTVRAADTRLLEDLIVDFSTDLPKNEKRDVSRIHRRGSAEWMRYITKLQYGREKWDFYTRDEPARKKVPRCQVEDKWDRGRTFDVDVVLPVSTRMLLGNVMWY